MNPHRQLASLAVLTALAVALPCAGAEAETSPATPLPSSSYAVAPACEAPSFLHASCLSEQLVPLTAQARAHTHPIGVTRSTTAAQPAASAAAGGFGLRPQDIHSAYSLPATGSGEPVLALVDAYNDPTAKADLESYDKEFGLGECNEANGCFRQVGQTGSSEAKNLPFPKTSKELEEAQAGGSIEKREASAAIGWGIEISLDIEAARATCKNCRLLLVEANSTSYTSLEAAVRTAETMGANVISNSWGGDEFPVSAEAESTGPFNDKGVVITASSGDNGYLGWDAEFAEESGFTSYPAASPHVVAVGGTRLALGAGSSWAGEQVWNGSGASGGGCSLNFAAPEWQQAVREWLGVGCEDMRSVADVAADADPYSGFAVTATSSRCESEVTEGATKKIVHWCTYGGTSLASPIVAGVFGLAGGAHGVEYPAKTLYETRRHAPGMLHDVTVGSNGECTLGVSSKGIANCTPAEEAGASCSGQRTCLASKGYDGPSGVGTPDGIGGFQPGAAEPGAEEEGEEHHEEAAKGPAPPPPGPVAPAVVTPPVTSGGGPAAGGAVLQLSRLALTPVTLIALNRHRPAIAKIGFSFELNRAGSVRVSLARRARVDGRVRWLAVGRSSTLAAVAGRNGRRLSGRTRLTPGLYRLTVTPAGGKPQSLPIHIG